MDKNLQKVIDLSPALSRLATYLVFFLTPVVFFKYWMSSFVSSKLPVFFIFSALAFFFLAINLIFRPENRPTRRQLLPLLPPILLVGSLGVSGLLAPLRGVAFWSTTDRGDGWFFFLHLLLLVVTVFILVLKDRTGTYKRNLIISALAASLVVAVTVWLGNEGFNWSGAMLSGSQGGGLLGNSSFTATYFLFAIFLGLMVIFSPDTYSKAVRRLALATTILIGTSPVFVNFSLWYFAIPFKSIFTTPQALLGSGRGAAVGIILGIAVAIAFRMIYAQKRLWKIVGAGVVILSIIGYLGFFVAIQKDGNSLQTAFTEQAGGNRLIFWKIARQAISKKPILGWGLENFRVPFHQNFDPALIREAESSEPWTDRAHNIFYDMMVAGGYLGLLLFLAVIGSLTWGIYSAGKKKLLNAWSAALLLGSVYAYLFQGLFVFNTIFSYLMLGFLYAFIFGLLERGVVLASLREEKINTNHLFLKTVLGSVVAGAVLASFVFVTFPLAHTASLFGKIIATPFLERTALWSRIADDRGTIRQGVDLARLALYAETEFGKKRTEIFSSGNENIRKIFSNDFQILGDALNKSAEIQKEQGMVMYMTLNMTARIYNSALLLSGQKNETQLARAEYYAREAIKESPTNPQGYWILAQTLILQTRVGEADAMLEKAISIDPYNKQSHRISIQIANSVGDKKAVALRTERAKEYIPNFSGL